MRRTAFVTALLAAACASEPNSETNVEVQTDGEQPQLVGGNDAPPRVELTLRAADGTRLAPPERALAHASSAAGVALIDAQRQLVLIGGDGKRRVLAAEAGAPPARGARGELFYVAMQDSLADLRVLEPGGADRVLAGGLASAGLLAPQADGRVLFVAAKNGGIAGLWVSSGGETRCLTNCDLKTGEPWGDRFVPPPGEIERMKLVSGRVEWQGFDGRHHAVTLGRMP